MGDVNESIDGWEERERRIGTKGICGGECCCGSGIWNGRSGERDVERCDVQDDLWKRL